MSSTAVVVQVLSEEKRLGSTVGRASFSVLLLQDIAVVPVLFAVSMLGVKAETDALSQFAVAIGQAAVVVAALIVGGRLGLRPLFRLVARTRSPELFMAACLLVIIGTSAITAIAGLSSAMGALIAGLLLAETEYRRQVEVMIEPFKGLLVGVFLISVGMSLDLPQVVATPLAVAIAVGGLIALKTAIIAPIAKLFGLSWIAAVQSGLLLGAAGEFGFIVIREATDLKLVPAANGEFALLVAALTMASIPLLSKLGRMLERQLPADDTNPLALIPLPDDETPRVIIAGFGRVGQVVAAMLTACPTSPSIWTSASWPRHATPASPLITATFATPTSCAACTSTPPAPSSSPWTPAPPSTKRSSPRAPSARTCRSSPAPRMRAMPPISTASAPATPSPKRSKRASSSRKRFWSTSACPWALSSPRSTKSVPSSAPRSKKARRQAPKSKSAAVASATRALQGIRAAVPTGAASEPVN
jgi:hypothetical protein